VQVALHTPTFGLGDEMSEPQKPQWVKPRIIAAPKIRQIYWCDFWKDAHLPEMWKTRPVIVISYRNRLHGPCLMIPTTTEPGNESNPWAYKLSIKIEGVFDSWALCNQPSTVAPSRLSSFSKGKIPLLPKADFNQVLELLAQWLPAPFKLEP
jgi:mRNA interferase MazF